MVGTEMGIQKASAGNRIYDIVSRKDYYPTKLIDDTAPIAVLEGEYFYPELNQEQALNGAAGVFNTKAFIIINEPTTEAEKEMLHKSNIIDFNGGSIKHIIESSNSLKSVERRILTTPGRLFKPNPLETDTAEMRALKEAVSAKDIDIDKYENRFGANFNNDKRLFTKSSITMSKLKTICDNLDIKVTLVLEDKDADTPNPIGRQIVVELVGGED